MENLGAFALAEAFELIGTMVEVRVPQNGMHTAGIRALAKSLSKNRTLETIELSDNSVKSGGAEMVARVIRRCPKLRCLLLESTLLREQGGLLLAKAIADGGGGGLERLNLSYNEMPTPVAAALRDALAGARGLRRIELSGNGFGDDGLAGITAAFGDMLVEVEDNEDPEDLEEPERPDTEYEEEDDEEEVVGAADGGGKTNSGGKTSSFGVESAVDVAAKEVAAKGSGVDTTDIFQRLDAALAPAIDGPQRSIILNTICVGLLLIKGEDGWATTPLDLLKALWDVVGHIVCQPYCPVSIKRSLAAIAGREGMAQRKGCPAFCYKLPTFGARMPEGPDMWREQVVALCLK